MIKAIWFIFYSEFLLLLRRSQEWLYPLGFFSIVISLFPIALSPDPAFLKKYIVGCIWLSALLANFLSVETVFASDLEDGNVEQLLLSPIPLTLSMSAKLAAHWVVIQVPLILLTPLLGLIFQLSVRITGVLALSLFLGTPILTLLGCEMVALTLGLRQQGVLIGILLLPLTIPVLIFSANIVQQAQAGLAINGSIAFLAALFLISIAVLPLVIATTIRISVDD